MVKELRPVPITSKGKSVRLDWIDDQDQLFAVHQLSDGTLRAIALITALAQPSERLPRFISIDEPELGLHPAAITILADLARSVSRHCQVLFATQSTAFLDHFQPEEVVVVERARGVTTLRRLDAAELRGWLEDYSLSQIFDKGVVGGGPLVRLLVVVEGQTEEAFVNDALARHLWNHEVYASATIVGTPRRRGSCTGLP